MFDSLRVLVQNARMIAVTGATGHLGRLVIAAMLKRVPASSIVAVVRNVEKAKDSAALGVHVRRADYNEPSESILGSGLYF